MSSTFVTGQFSEVFTPECQYESVSACSTLLLLVCNGGFSAVKPQLGSNTLLTTEMTLAKPIFMKFYEVMKFHEARVNEIS
jgi:hypothetical protein